MYATIRLIRTAICAAAIASMAWGATQAPSPKPPQTPSVFATPAEQSAAQKRYEALFGAEDKSVAAHGNIRDQAAFAAKLLDASKKLSDDKGLRFVLLTRVRELAPKDPISYALGCEALEELEKLDAPNESVYHGQLIDLLRLRTRRGPTNDDRLAAAKLLVPIECQNAESLAASAQYGEAYEMLKDAMLLASHYRLSIDPGIRHRADTLAARRDTAASLDKLKARLTADPGNHQLQQQVLTTALLQLDSPAALVSVSSDFSEGGTQRFILLAAKPVSECSEPECKALIGWYEQFAQPTAGVGRNVAITRILRYYDRILKLHTTQDAELLQTREKLLSFEKQACIGKNGVRTADAIVIWNAHNAEFHDRGAKVIDLTLYSHGEVVFEKKAVPMPWEVGRDNRDPALTFRLPPLIFDTVRVTIDAFHDAGGALSEIQVIRDDSNIILHAPVKASATQGGMTAEAIDDGTTTSTTLYKGYWALPNGVTGWIEITIPQPIPLN